MEPTTTMTMMDAATIMTMLDVSTAHIQRKTALALGEEGGPPRDPEVDATLVIIPWSTWGWILWVPPIEDLRSEHYDDLRTRFPDLVTCLHAARRRGCDYLRLDCDGSEYDWLPTYE